MVIQSYKLLFMSTPVGPLGTGLGGGVELTLFNIAQPMLRRGHKLKVVAPQGFVIGSLPIQEIPEHSRYQPKIKLVPTQFSYLLIRFWRICGIMLAKCKQTTI